MNCPKCEHTDNCKDGIIKKRQRYQCKSCGYRFTVLRKSDVRTDEMKRMALSMYLEGLGYRTIASILQVNHVTVFYWIKELGKHAEKIKSKAAIPSVSIKELHAAVGRKKKSKGYVLLLLDIETGASILCWDDRKKTSGKKKTVKVN